MTMEPLLVAVVILGASGAAASAANRWPRAASAIGMSGVLIACATGLPAALRALAGEGVAGLRLPWPRPFGGFAFGLDPLSAFFLVPLLVLSALAAPYGYGYLLAHRSGKWLGAAWFFFNVFVASMVLTLITRDVLAFLISWEIMTLASYFLVAFEHEHEEARRASWVYLIAGHLGVAFLLALFLLLAKWSGSMEFAAFAHLPSLGPGLPFVLLALALLGFGVKAGLVPLHVWLPEAHAAAPSHVSALMSGVLIKLGLYGILRILSFLPPLSWAGPALMALGFLGAAFGISQAAYQRDLKRALAYSSVENVGLITIGLGIAFWGMDRGDPRLAALGLLGASFHLWNHVLMKGLMFLCAGSIVHGCGTKDLEALGGLGKTMPYTSAAFVVGALAIGGLPPLNGFVSEWLLYRGLFQGGIGESGGPQIAAFLSIGLFALIGGLAVLCFVRLAGIALLGEARSEAARQAHESSWWLLAPVCLAAAGTVLLALFPGVVIAPVAELAGQLLGPQAADHVRGYEESLSTIGACNAAVWAGVGLVAAVFLLLTRRPAPAPPTWDCGYGAPSPRMQYTARSFVQIMAQRLLPAGLSARAAETDVPAAPFPLPARFATECPDPFTRAVYEPFFARWAGRFSRLRWLQQGLLHIYLLYILLAAVGALLWMSLRAWMGT